LEFEGSQSMFAVFDGHGGREVAHYCKKHYENILLTNEEFKKGNFKESLRQSFLEVDNKLNAGGL